MSFHQYNVFYMESSSELFHVHLNFFTLVFTTLKKKNKDRRNSYPSQRVIARPAEAASPGRCEDANFQPLRQPY